MNAREWDAIVQAITEYRACPEQAQLGSLRRVLSDCTLYVPVGDFDGNNAVISPLSSAQGGHFIPLYATKENVYPAQHSEGVRPADWKHILSQMPFADGYVIEPYSVNFAFDGRFIDLLLDGGVFAVADSDADAPDVEASDGEASDGDVDDDVFEAGVSDDADKLEGEVADEQAAGEPVVHAWPPAAGVETETSEPQDSSDEVESENQSEGDTRYQVNVPASVPNALSNAVQAVSDELTVPVWLFEVRGVSDKPSYLMILNTAIEWFDACGPDAVNRILARFPDPGVSLDFAPRESEAGRYADGQEPHYYPRINSVVQNRMQQTQGNTQSFFRRFFKR